MPQDRYLASRTTNIAQVAPKRIRQVIAGAWLVSVAIVASWMLAVLFPLGPSFNLQATRHESALVISSPPSLRRATASGAERLESDAKLILSERNPHQYRQANGKSRSDVIRHLAGS